MTKKGITQKYERGLSVNKGHTERNHKIGKWEKESQKQESQNVNVMSKIGLCFMLTWYMILCAERCAIFLDGK